MLVNRTEKSVNCVFTEFLIDLSQNEIFNCLFLGDRHWQSTCTLLVFV